MAPRNKTRGNQGRRKPRTNDSKNQPSNEKEKEKAVDGKQTTAEKPEDPVNVCSICAEVARDWAVGECPHVVCGDCSHRMRVLYNRKSCVMCNEELNSVVLVPLRHYRKGMTFQEAVALPGVFHDAQVNMWFLERPRHQYLRGVRGFKCSHKACNTRHARPSIFRSASQLKAHARSEHRAVYCDICFNGKKQFISEMKLYTLDKDRNYSSHLRGHLRKDHPMCKFCRKYFLDDDQLYAHLQEKHESCSICERNGRMHEYYANFQQLEAHYAKEHYVCKHESCRGLVFATLISLQAHEHSQHNTGTNRSRPLRVNLSDLHGDRDPQRMRMDPLHDERIERERQAARRRAFLSTNVVFSGSFPLEDTANDPPPGGTTSSNDGVSSAALSAESSNAVVMESMTSAARESAVSVQRPDDGHFHPLALPRDGDELHTRNTALVREMKSILDAAAFEQFKQASGLFRTGQMSPDEYFDAATEAFGVRHAVRDILPELVALMPSPLLREPLLQTCLRRTDTQSNAAGFTGSSAQSSNNSENASSSQDQFPALNGATPPRVVRPRVRRFGVAGPEEFPRLNRVNRAGSSEESSTAALAESVQAMSVRDAAARPAASSSRPRTDNQRTAASVLRQPAPHQRMFGQQSARAGSSARGGQGARFDASAFPSLLSAAPAPEPTQAPVSEPTSNASSSSHAPDADVSMRVGAVWGSNTAGSGRGGKKRGPGRGHGRRPATPPKVVSSLSDFPEIRQTAPNASSSTSAEASWSTSAGRRNKVIDVSEIARSRKVASAKSSLPKIGGSGYGFAWERKKAQQKRKEIKKSVEENSKAADTSRLQSEVFNAKKAQLEATGSASSSSERLAERQSTSELRQIGKGANDSPSSISDANDNDQKHDPFAYLRGDPSAGDAVASFLGTR